MSVDLRQAAGSWQPHRAFPELKGAEPQGQKVPTDHQGTEPYRSVDPATADDPHARAGLIVLFLIGLPAPMTDSLFKQIKINVRTS